MSDIHLNDVFDNDNSINKYKEYIKNTNNIIKHYEPIETCTNQCFYCNSITNILYVTFYNNLCISVCPKHNLYCQNDKILYYLSHKIYPLSTYECFLLSGYEITIDHGINYICIYENNSNYYQITNNTFITFNTENIPYINLQLLHTDEYHSCKLSDFIKLNNINYTCDDILLVLCKIICNTLYYNLNDYGSFKMYDYRQYILSIHEYRPLIYKYMSKRILEEYKKYIIF